MNQQMKPASPPLSPEGCERFFELEVIPLKFYYGWGVKLLGVYIGFQSEVIMPAEFASDSDIVVYVTEVFGELIFVGKLRDFVGFFIGHFGDIRMYVDKNTIDDAITK